MAEQLMQWIDQLTDLEFQVFIVAWILCMAYLLWRGYSYFQQYRLFADTPTSRISSAAQGYVELKGWGELMPGPEIRSPLSDQRCLWYHCIVEKKQKLKNSRQWVEQTNDISDEIFHLRDESGTCIVIPDGATVIPSQTRRWSGNSPRDRHGSNHSSFNMAPLIGMGDYRFTEKLILVADPLHVVGDFESRESRLPIQTLRQQTAEILKTWKQQPGRFLAPFDRNGDGKIDQQEWKRVKKQAELEVHKHHPHTVYHVIQKPGYGSKPFLISTRDEEDICRHNQRWIAVSMLGFLVLLFAGWFLIQIRYV